MFSNYEWILFDLDNTLLDFSRSSELAFEKMLETVGIPSKRKPFYKIYSKINKKYWKDFEQHKINGKALHINRFIEFQKTAGISELPNTLAALYAQFLIECSNWVAGAEQAVKRLQKSHKLAIITNGLSEIQNKRIEKHQLNTYFKHFFISEEIGFSKPNRLFFELVHKKIGKPNKKKVLVIGDNQYSDIFGANNFGFDSCWFNYYKSANSNSKATFNLQKW